MAKDLGDMPFYATGVLSAEDMARAKEQARAAVQKELHDKLFKEALEEAEREARIEAGFAPKVGPTKLDEEKVSVMLNLPESVTPIPAIVIDGRAYYDGQVYKLPKSIALQLHEMQARAWENDDRMSRGREKDRRRPKPQVLNGATGRTAGAPLALVASNAA